jgi:hypothetical protein
MFNLHRAFAFTLFIVPGPFDIYIESLPLPMSIQLMLGDLAIEGITVDTQNLCGFGLIATRFYECRLNESLFKFA